MHKDAARLACLRNSSRVSSLQTAAADAAPGPPAPPSQAFRSSSGSFLGSAGVPRSGHRRTLARCLRVASAAAYLASVLQQRQQQAWLSTNGSSSRSAFISNPSVVRRDCVNLASLASHATVCAAQSVHQQQQQQRGHTQQKQKGRKRETLLEGMMSPGCLSAQGDLAVADTPAAAEACAPAEETAPEPSTDVPFGKIAAGAPAAMESDAFVHLDKTVFNKYEDVTCLRVPLHQLQELSKALRKYLFKRRNVRPIILDILESSQKGGPQRESQREQLEAAQQEEQPEEEMEKQKKAGKVLNVAGRRGFKCLLLNPSIGPELEGLPESLQSLLKETDIQVLRHRVFLGYENLSVVECLAALLPEGVETPHRFECVGHIAHLNLPSSLLKFKYAIGQVILDKHPQLRTVVLKTGIGSKWRELQFELIAGEAAYVAKVKEADLVFEVDYAKAFWNSRLSCERQRIAATIPNHAVVLDAFAGVGAFAVFLARTGCVVAANDGNPSSAASMQANVKRNGVANLVDVHNQDARDFLRSQAQPAAIAALQRKRLQAGGTPSNAKDAIARKVEYRSAVEVHVLMNLPELAIEFLDVFPGLLAESEPQPKRHCPDGEALSSKAAEEVTPQVSRWRVHCYAFCRDPRPEQELKPRVRSALGCWPEPIEIHEVRDVAPNKQMYCLAFDLPPDVLYGERGSTTRRAGAEPAPH